MGKGMKIKINPLICLVCTWCTHSFCLPLNRRLWRPLPEQRHVSSEWERLQAVPLSASVHGQHMWNWQMPLLSWRRVHPQQQLLFCGAVHLSVSTRTEHWHQLWTFNSLFHHAVAVSISCANGRVQPSCYTCDTNEYCANGQCSLNSLTRLPECR